MHPSPDVERGPTNAKTCIPGKRCHSGGIGFGARGVRGRIAPEFHPPSDQPLPPGDLDGAVAKLRAQYVAQFDADYVDNVVLPSFLNSIFDGERPVLPMIDVALTKENALPYDMWGLLSMSWKPAPDDGVTVFLQGTGETRPRQSP